MIVAKGIRQGVSLVRQCRELAKLDRLQHLELMPQIFHLLAPFMEMLLRRIILRDCKRVTAIQVDALPPDSKHRPTPAAQWASVLPAPVLPARTLPGVREY